MHLKFHHERCQCDSNDVLCFCCCCRCWRWWWWLEAQLFAEMLRVIEYFAKSLKFIQWHHSKAWLRFPSMVTMALSCIISEKKPAIDRKSLFLYPLHSTPPLGRSLSNYCNTVWYKKQSLRIRLAVSIEYRRVTDRRTDRRTSSDSVVCIEW